MRAFLLAILLVSALPAFALAAGKSVRKTEPGTHVGMPFLIAPVAIGGKLAGYSYISSKLVASTPPASVLIREKLAFIQDAFVRDVNEAPTGKAQDPLTVDTAALTARLVADARRIVGSSKVVTITFVQIKFSPLHPKATTDDPDTTPAPATQKPAATPVAEKKN